MAVVLAAPGIYMWVLVTETNGENAYQSLLSNAVRNYIHAFGLELTFARRHAIGPPVIDIFVAKSSTVLEPSAARSAATDSA